VRMAGGFKRSAYTASADVTSYVIQNGARVRTEHQTIEIARALAGNGSADMVLKPGDVVTIHQLSGWKEIGASVTVKGEVQYPGTYGIEEGEKLSSLLLRTQGFRADAYPEGAVLERLQVRELAEKSRRELIQRIEASAMTPKLGAGAEQAAVGQAMFVQRQQIVKTLKNQPASGRLVIRISSNIKQWQNTPADIELRAGDVLIIPKLPNFVMVSGQVYNAAAITYAPGKNAEWYLRQAGGATDMANKKDIYIIRASGSVIGRGGTTSGWWTGNVLSTAVHPGDTVVVPEKIIGGGTFWRTALSTAQVMSALAITAGVVATF
jgi:protein involved in polysaccharide export with SLBB domain